MSKNNKDYDFRSSELKWQNFWQDQQIYQWQNDKSRENTYIIDTPPPTVSGDLHIGHVYSYTQTDFIARFQRMLGKDIFYPIGFDDNGLPTERLVEKQRRIRAQNTTREEFVKICQEVVAEEEQKFRRLFQSIGISFDWNLEYQTISNQSCKLSQMSFLDLLDKGEVYRSYEPILWDPLDQTALAQADIEDIEKSSVMNYIKFELVDNNDLIIATSRPEMLPAVVGIFFHPNDKRYQHLKEKFAISPLFKQRIPIFSDDSVIPEKGTGLVMCATFGDQTDLSWWRKYKLKTRIIIDETGRMIEPEFDYEYQDLQITREIFNLISNLKILQARAKIIEILLINDLIIKQEDITQIVKCAERSKAPLEIIMSPQWFIKTLNHKEKLLERANELIWHPESMKVKLINWINSLAWDWCISRQRFFGVGFPIWYSKRAGEEGKIITATIDQLPVNPLVTLPKGYSKDEVECDICVMDTWATSAISPQLSSLAVSEKYAINYLRHQKLYPMDLRPQAHEIIRTWSFYTILKSHLHQNILPWKNIMISGWCLASDKTKMSKSIGNSINPINLIDKYGADVVRYWSASTKLGADTAFNENILIEGKRLINKLWNASKFIGQHFELIQNQHKDFFKVELNKIVICQFDQWLLKEILKLLKSVENFLVKYDYSTALSSVENFYRNIFCDNYLEIVKIRVYNQQNKNDALQYSALFVLYHSYNIILKLFAPFLPHITEELHQILYNPAVSIHKINGWPIINLSDLIIGDDSVCESLIEISSLVKKAKAEKNLSIKAPIEILEIIGMKSLSEDLKQDLANVTSAKLINIVNYFNFNGDILKSNKLQINIKFS